MEDLSIEEGTYAEYQGVADGPWLSAGCCKACIVTMRDRQFTDFVHGLQNATCAAQHRRMLANGPPINVREVTTLPCPDDGEIVGLWFCDEGDTSPQLKGSLTGEARLEWWEEQKKFAPANETDDDATTAADAGAGATTATTDS